MTNVPSPPRLSDISENMDWKRETSPGIRTRVLSLWDYTSIIPTHKNGLRTVQAESKVLNLKHSQEDHPAWHISQAVSWLRDWQWPKLGFRWKSIYVRYPNFDHCQLGTETECPPVVNVSLKGISNWYALGGECGETPAERGTSSVGTHWEGWEGIVREHLLKEIRHL